MSKWRSESDSAPKITPGEVDFTLVGTLLKKIFFGMRIVHDCPKRKKQNSFIGIPAVTPAAIHTPNVY